MPDADFVTLSTSGLTARISPLGAELWSLTDARGHEWMTDADPAYWTGHAPVLFPIVGALADDRYRLEDREYTLTRHGFARRSRFKVISASADTATFRLADSPETRAAYPFAFRLELMFRIEGMTLQMQATISNTGDETLPFSFGFHPAFAWPLPGGAPREAHRITFAEPEPQPVRRLDPASGLLLPDAQPTPVRGRALVPAPALFEADALIWDRLNSRALTFGAPGGGQIAIAMPDTPMLGIWQKPGAAYLCIEPWQGIADTLGWRGDFRDRPGVVRLPPGASRALRMDVTVMPV